MLVLRESDIFPILKGLTRDQCQHLLQALWKALASYSGHRNGANGEKLIHQPIREQIVTSRNHATLFMPASDTNTTTGIKIVTLPGHGGPPKGAINICSPEGDLEGLLNAELITAFRTALASMIPFQRFQLREGANILVFGAGKQAEWHIRLALLLAGEKITKITVVNRGARGAERLKSDLDADVRGIFPGMMISYIGRDSSTFAAEILGTLVSEADAIFCCTPSTEPLFSSSYLGDKPRFISLIGSYKPHMQEIDSTTLLSGRSTIIVDSKEACLHEAGELIKAQVSESQLVEIGELFENPHAASRLFDSGSNVVFKCVGMGIMDLVIGRELLALAKARQVGITIDDF
ncbi:hypothetical protein D8B26_002550 [Coccidioides posadasii str. Silveira]|uniref:Uncharacterized protein n=2 Tax=Coccidioides posadasii TaxID=199306 RepID=E9DIV5_COCPS|nr:Ornithine cyclodeaminase/mu-crystallin family protein [Coccidioides posadasii C735 delta SOWgp]EER26937.1 Ornithine cyclodeaminase/mu-crystallin family protein [Coccidioides posadasii C735 delta SOWgp]EFW13710.1 conserved hypothetical protein [Coccidioides posadasii str. Silveira]QVM07856.1 hypothetical protein D8B26_002550 [Coccidioides posadasii str. Silveira]|eukprot:XP_003069082.1 Ornithine cyclodeaminase/mu-crystallin family protein [Coccidioides posadasii C735 delta SOWgp]